MSLLIAGVVAYSWCCCYGVVATANAGVDAGLLGAKRQRGCTKGTSEELLTTFFLVLVYERFVQFNLG